MSQNTADKSQVKVLVIESEKVTRIGIKYALRENPNIKIAGSTGKCRGSILSDRLSTAGCSAY